MIIFLSGPITGNKAYKRQFKTAEEELIAQGHAVLNPATLPEGMEYEHYMHICISMIDVCDAVYQLRGWQKSLGAQREYGYALGKDKIILEA